MRWVLRGLIVLEVVMFVIGVVSSFLGEALLPAPLKEWVEASHEMTWTAWDIGTTLAGLVLIIFLLISWIGLWFFWKPAYYLYIAGWVGGVLNCALCGPTVMDPVTAVFWDLSTLVSGAILGLLIFSPLREEFFGKKPPRSDG